MKKILSALFLAPIFLTACKKDDPNTDQYIKVGKYTYEVSATDRYNLLSNSYGTGGTFISAYNNPEHMSISLFFPAEYMPIKAGTYKVVAVAKNTNEVSLRYHAGIDIIKSSPGTDGKYVTVTSAGGKVAFSLTDVAVAEEGGSGELLISAVVHE